MNLVELLLDLNIALNVPIKKVGKNNNLTASQTLCILSIPFDGITQSELTNKLGLDLSTLSRNLKKLVDQKIVTKEFLKNDNRTSLITLSDKGQSIYNNILCELNNMLSNLNYDLEYDEIENIINSITSLHWSLIKINQNINEKND